MTAAADDVAHVPHSAQTHPNLWAMRMTWDDLLFMHWAVSSSTIETLLPAGLVVDTFEGRAYIAVVPFMMRDVRARFTPGVPGAVNFAELNVRTYVTCRGTPGVWFFSLDATSKLAVRAARAAFKLPYFDAAIDIDKRGDDVHYVSRRVHRGAAAASLDVTYAPTGSPFHAAEGTLERFLTDRLTLYAAGDDGVLYRGDIQHDPWPLQPATAAVASMAMTEQFGVKLPDEQPHMLFAKHLDVIAWWKIPVWPPSTTGRH